MRPIALVFEAADGRPLAATVLEPRRVEGAVVIASATGVPRRIYEGVAGCLADAGLAVLTFDYRGIGGSRQGGPLRHEPARMQDWGRLDLEGALGVDAPGVRRRSADGPRAQRRWPAHRASPRRPGTSPARRWSAPSSAGPDTGRGPRGPSCGACGTAHSRPDLGRSATCRCSGSGRARTSPPASPASGRPGAGGATTSSTRWSPEVREAYAGAALPGARAPHRRRPLRAAGAGWRPWSASTAGRREVHTISPGEAGAARIGHFGWVRPRFEEAIWAPIRDWFLERLLPSPLRRVG